MMDTKNQGKEVWDLFDENGNPRGKFVRGNGRIPPGLYHKTVEVIPTDMAGVLLLTRRSLLKRSGAGQLEFPAGSVISGETEKDAAIRELEEETGLRPKELYFLQKVRTNGIFRYTFLAYVPNMTNRNIVYAPEEVMGHMFVSYDEWLDLLPTAEYNGFRTRFYTEKLIANVKQLVNKNSFLKKPIQPQQKKHAPLTASNSLATKPPFRIDASPDDGIMPPELAEWEPNYEQGDDGT